MQTSLFDTDALVLTADAQGGIRYWPNQVPRALCESWMQQLLAHCHWRSERRPMYDRMVDVPRLQAWHALNDPACPALVHDLLAVANKLAPAPFTHAGFNLYRDERDSVAMHHDKLHQLQPGQPIVLVSLGAPRDMLIRSKTRAHRPLRITLEPGSVLAMSHASQLTHEHGIPKSGQPCGPRISCGFRVRPRANPATLCSR